MDLTTLARCKAIISAGVGSIPADQTIASLIAMASSAAMSFCSRTFQRNIVANLTMNGTGTRRQMLPFNPVVSITGPLTIDTQTVQLLPALQGGSGFDTTARGYMYDSKFLYLFGGLVFGMGFQNVLVPQAVTAYTTSEGGTIPDASPSTIVPHQGTMLDAFGNPFNTSGFAFADQGVVFSAGGNALVQVSGAPAAGQYNFSSGVYTFNQASDKGKGVVMSYDFVPAAVEQAVVETVGGTIRRAANLGIRSRTLGQETVSYNDASLSKAAMTLLQPYRWVVTP